MRDDLRRPDHQQDDRHARHPDDRHARHHGSRRRSDRYCEARLCALRQCAATNPKTFLQHGGRDRNRSSVPRPTNEGGQNLEHPNSLIQNRKSEQACHLSRRALSQALNAYRSNYRQKWSPVVPARYPRDPRTNRLQHHGRGLRLGKNLGGAILRANHWLERDVRLIGRHLRRPVRAPRSRRTPLCHSNSLSAECSRAKTKNRKCA